MNDEYVSLDKDLDGDGDVDPARVYTLDDGSNVLVGDLDGDGEDDFTAVDADGDGVYETSYDANTGETTDLTADAAA
ncbi:MAG TPA: hypothetical protein VL738_22965 [Dactylosporangium sp.]|jgi:hypothetical protein|nr:hypothetical protein [Dactylosporangium sp.]